MKSYTIVQTPPPDQLNYDNHNLFYELIVIFEERKVFYDEVLIVEGDFWSLFYHSCSREEGDTWKDLISSSYVRSS